MLKKNMPCRAKSDCGAETRTIARKRRFMFPLLAAAALLTLCAACSKRSDDESDQMEGKAEAKKALGLFEIPGDPSDLTVKLSGNVNLELVKVEAGTFEMSARDGENYNDEVPHQVTLKHDFYIGRTEVTQAQWLAVMRIELSYFTGDDLPMENVSWYDAMEFCEKLNDMGKAPKGWRFTLPTETQWEYAARGGKKSKGYKYSGSNNIDEVAWCIALLPGASSGSVFDESVLDYEHASGTQPVGRKKPNELGLYDMSGNVWEWCLDDWQKKSDKLTAEFTRGSNREDAARADRGGSWFELAWDCRSASRDYFDPGYRDRDLGFRVALVPVR